MLMGCIEHFNEIIIDILSASVLPSIKAFTKKQKKKKNAQ
jgi:type II secretory pathway pseudopilin PulG